MSLPLSKLIDIEDFDSADLRPYLLEINEQEAASFGSDAGDIVPDSKQWECAMALRVIDANGHAASGRMIAGIGAGTEATIFSLARRGALVFPVDRYLQRTPWSDVAPAGMLVAPSQYCPISVPRGHVIPVHSNALALNLPSNTFDAVFSSGSIEHFGSLDRVAVAAREIGRILKPGGVASIATEFRIDGPSGQRWFDDNVILFTPELLQRYIVENSGLVLREPLDVRQSDRTFETRRNLVDFLQRAQVVHGLDEKRAVYPNLILYHDGFLFCSVVLTLYKDADVDAASGLTNRANIEAEVADENAALAAELERFQRSSTQAPAEDHALFGELERLRAEAEALRNAYDRSNAWKQWRLLRPARAIYRRIKRRNA